MDTANQIEQDALQLAPAKRVKLAERLIESVDSFTSPQLAREWDEEVKRRLDDVRQGRVQGIPAAQVMAKARKAVREARRISSPRRK